MQKFFFTLGADDNGGWVEITAEDRKTAIGIFSAYHPPRGEHNLLPYCCEYSEEEMKQTKMWKNGNHGRRCVERIIAIHVAFEE